MTDTAARLAHHEAAHLIAHVRLGPRYSRTLPRKVHIDVKENTGQMLYGIEPAYVGKEIPRLFYHVIVVSSFAGPFGEAYYEDGKDGLLNIQGDPFYYFAQYNGGFEITRDNDYGCAMKYLRHITGKEHDELLFHSLTRRLALVTARIILKEWVHIKRTAELIMESPEHCLSGETLEAAIASMR